jgi:hypothetical protein
VVSFLLNFTPKPCMHSSYFACILCRAHLILLGLVVLILSGEKHKIRCFALCNCLQPLSSLFDPNILLSTLCSNTLRLCSDLKVRDQVSYSLIVFYIPFFIFSVIIRKALFRSLHRICPSPRLCVIFRKKQFLFSVEMLASRPNPRWRTIPCHLSATSMRKLRTPHAVATRDPLNIS